MRDAGRTVMQTYSGSPLDILNPWPRDFRILDIAQALGKIARFTGHTMQHYSVAQHSVLVSMLLEGSGLEMEGLMHDAHEAYIGDISSPMKNAIREMVERETGAKVDPVAIIAGAIDQAMAAQFGFLYPLPDAVKVADMEAMTIERRQTMAPPSGVMWSTDVAARDLALACLTPADAADAFLTRYKTLAYRPKAAAQ